MRLALLVAGGEEFPAIVEAWAYDRWAILVAAYRRRTQGSFKMARSCPIDNAEDFVGDREGRPPAGRTPLVRRSNIEYVTKAQAGGMSALPRS
jgi:hypothetical protein